MSIPMYAEPRRVRFDWIGESFQFFQKKALLWVGMQLLWAVMQVALMAVSGYGSFYIQFFHNIYSAQRTPPVPPGAVGELVYLLASLVVAAFFYSGMMTIAVKQVRGLDPTFADFAGAWKVAPMMLVYHVVYSILSTIGFALCFLPGLIIASELWPGYAMIADEVSVGTAISASYSGVKTDMWMAALLNFVVWLMIVASSLACGLGGLVTMPMAIIISALAYRDMIGMPQVPSQGGTNGNYYQGPAAGSWPPPPNSWPPPPGQNDSGLTSGDDAKQDRTEES